MKYFSFLVLLVILFPYWVQAQTQQDCGYVLYKEDFGGQVSSPDIGEPLPGNVTSYSFTTSIPVEDGQYSIRKKVTGHPATWHHGPDHSGNGYMMLINASYDAGKFYEKKITNLCQGSSFYFSAWIANLMKAGAAGPLDPNIRFKILKASDRSLVAEYTTGILPRYSTFTWKQYGIHFKLPAGESSVILQIFNNQGGGNGNDLVLDDITFSLCGPPVQVTVSGTYKQTHDACKGDDISFKANIGQGFYQNPLYQWQFSQDNSQWQNIPGATGLNCQVSRAQSSDSGWYRILVAEKGNINSPHCRLASKPVMLGIWTSRPFSISSNSPVCEGNTLELKAPEAVEYFWRGPGDFTSDQQDLRFEAVNLSQQGDYTLTRITRGGCTSKAQIKVSVQRNDLSVSLGNDSLLCEGTATYLNATNAGASYQWNTGAQAPVLKVQKGGFYKVIVSKGVCSVSDSLSIREILMPVVMLGNDTSVCMGEPYILDAAFKDAEKYLWQDGTVTPTHLVKQSGNYEVAVSNKCGIAVDHIHIEKVPCADHLLFPTAFTPNQDGQNDNFHPKVLLRISNYELSIFDRWGRLVFLSKDPAEGWDGSFKGKIMPLGSYVWIAHYNRKQDEQPVSQKGTVTLLR